MMSQATVIGRPQPKSWDDFEQGCLATFSGGHRGIFRDAYQHGMRTVFTLLRNEFPPAEACKAAPELLTACKALVAALENGAVSGRLVDEVREVIAKAD